MGNVLENVVATIIVTALSTATGLVLQAFGFSTSTSVTTAVGFLLALIVLFLAAKRYYPLLTRGLTERLLESALNADANEASGEKIMFKKKILERVLLENTGVELEQNSSVVEFLNQEACESHIREASRNAKSVKILTIRGEKYFLGPKSLLHSLCSSKRVRDSSVEVLVLAPDSQHITNKLAEDLDHDSAEEIKAKMRIVFDYLSLLARRYKNFEVKCYDETPNLKILMFDDVMFVSSFAGGGPKNDHNTKMLQITREGNPLFMGLERYFDDLSKRSVSP